MIRYSRLVPVFFTVLIMSCKSKHSVVTSKSQSKKYTTKTKVPQIQTTFPEKDVMPTEEVVVSTSVTNKVIRKALSFKGTKYKYGGTSKSGMDCSGLMYTSFKSASINLPRTSFEQSKKGVRVSKSKIEKGDLVFFKTSSRNRINHVGLVVSVDGSSVKFVHSSSSRGVMISSLKEGYWSNAFSEARRLNKTAEISNSSVTNNNVPSVKKYIVKKGDTLYAIARKYSGVSVETIISYNNLNTTSLRPGMELSIPQG